MFNVLNLQSLRLDMVVFSQVLIVLSTFQHFFLSHLQVRDKTIM